MRYYGCLPRKIEPITKLWTLASFLIYNPDNLMFIDAADRYDGTENVKIPIDFKGDTLHCYMSFASADGKLVGDSVYIGFIIV